MSDTNFKEDIDVNQFLQIENRPSKIIFFEEKKYLLLDKIPVDSVDPDYTFFMEIYDEIDTSDVEDNASTETNISETYLSTIAKQEWLTSEQEQSGKKTKQYKKKPASSRKNVDKKIEMPEKKAESQRRKRKRPKKKKRCDLSRSKLKRKGWLAKRRCTLTT